MHCMGEAGKPLVLVVEDEEIVREIVCADLAEAGFWRPPYG